MKTILALVLLAIATSAAAQRSRVVDACARLSYYWEIGNSAGVLSSGRVGAASPTATEPIDIASASKWLYAAAVLQSRTPTAQDVRFLTLSSGFNDFGLCSRSPTVASCAMAGDNDLYTASADGKFYYGGSHMQQHAALGPWAPLNADALGAAMRSALGIDVTYRSPQLAGGATLAPAEFGAFLRKMLKNEYTLSSFLGASAVCTNPTTCATALNSPLPANAQWLYSLGHWVEDDGTFSSPGALGFYPWINSTRTLYGIVARDDGSAWASAQCGRQIRNAWK